MKLKKMDLRQFHNFEVYTMELDSVKDLHCFFTKIYQPIEKADIKFLENGNILVSAEYRYPVHNSDF